MYFDQSAVDRAVEMEIRPALDRIEATRKGSWLLVRVVAAGIFGFFGFIGLILWALLTVWLAVGALVFGAILAAIVAWMMVRLYRGVARTVMVPPLAAAIGDMRYTRAPEGFDARAVVELGILPPAQAIEAEHMLVGTHRGTGFRLVELSSFDVRRHGGGARARSRRRRVWHGLLVEVDVPVPFEGPVILSRDRGAVARQLGRQRAEATRVDIPHSAFNDLFEVHADEPEEARRLITPALAESLVALSKARPGKALAAAFARGVFLLTVPLPRGYLDQGSLFQPAERLLDRVPALVRELTLPHRVIDYLAGDRPGPLL